MKRRICLVTGTRAEYGLLQPLLNELVHNSQVELQLIACGMHMTQEFGLTYKQIEEDGFKIDRKIEMILSSDTAVAITKSVALGQISFAESFEQLAPHIVVLLGDRFEILAAAIAAMFARIPIAHIHGGELTEGAVDESIRHAISKMSHLHFTSTEEYRHRVIQLGETPNTVFNVGAMGVDNIKKITLLSKSELEKSLNFKLGRKNLLITFHPVTLEIQSAEKQFQELLDALDTLDDTNFIFSKPNADTDGRVIIGMIDSYVARHKNNAVAFTSLGQLRYLSAMRYVDGVVGNSSSGILEAPYFKIGTINIGDRQKGRLKPDSVIDCEPKKKSILIAIDLLYSDKFQKKLSNIEMLYGQGGAATQVKNILIKYSFDNILKKRFFNIPVPL